MFTTKPDRAVRADPVLPVSTLKVPLRVPIISLLHFPRSAADRSALPRSEIIDGRIGLDFPSFPDLADTAYLVEVSETLTPDDWEVLFDSRVDPVPAGGAGERLREEDSHSLDGGNPRRFLRLRIELVD